MNVKPVLGDWEIPRISVIRAAEHRAFVEMPIPGKVGSLWQDMNAAPTNLVIGGSLFGDEAKNQFLEDVRGKFKAGEPLTFVADIITATDIQYVIIETLRFEENAHRPDQIDYLIVLKESPPPPPPSDPFGGLDAGLLDQAGALMDAVGGALDALDALANLPSFSDPTAPLQGALEGVNGVVGQLGGVGDAIRNLFG